MAGTSKNKRAPEYFDSSALTTNYLLAQVVDGAGEGIIVYGKDLRYQVWNRKMAEMTGMPAERVLGKMPLEVFPFLKDTGLMEKFDDLAAGGEPETITINFTINESGKTGWVKDRTRALRDESGEIIGFIGVVSDVTDLKMTEETLLESEARFRSVFENSRDAIGLALDGVIVKANRSLVQLFGYDSVEELHGKPTLMLYPERVWDDIRRMRGSALASGRGGVFETTGIRKDGTEFDIEISSSTYEFKGRTYIVAVLRDISEKKRAGEALRASEDRYRTLLDSSPDAITIMDLNWNIIEISAATARMHGFGSREELVGVSALPFISPGERDRAKEGLVTALSRGEVLHNEYIFLKKDGTEFPVDVSAGVVLGGNGAPVAAIVMAKDISERKKAERELRESESKYRMLVDAANEGICALGGDFRVTFVNRRMCEMMGYAEEEVMGRLFEEFFFEEDIEDNRRHLENRRRGIVEQYERRIRRKDGGTLWTILSPAPILDEEGNFKGVFAMFTDITERKAAELEKEAMQQQLLHAQKMEAVGRLAGGIAHDFNNILAVIIGSAETALLQAGSGAAAATRLQRIFNSAVRARDLTMKLLTFARKEKLDIRNIAVDTLIVELSDMIKRSLPKNIKIEAALCEPHPHLMIDFNQMLQAMLNLCINAGDSMPDGGMLRIETGAAELDEAFCAGRGIKAGRYCAIRISDTGTGMEPEVLAKMYEPFFTTKERGKGTGLGLSISLGIVQGHGGRLEIDSEKGRGTTATVYLPIAGGTPDAEADAPEEDGLTVPVATVLLVDDDAEFIDTAAEMIASEGFKVIKTVSPLKAVEIYRERMAGIDVVLLDMIMPEMDGAAVFMEMKKLNPDVKAILCSGYSVDEQSESIIKLGIYSYLQKPFQRKELLKVLSTALAV